MYDLAMFNRPPSAPWKMPSHLWKNDQRVGHLLLVLVLPQVEVVCERREIGVVVHDLWFPICVVNVPQRLLWCFLQLCAHLLRLSQRLIWSILL